MIGRLLASCCIVACAGCAARHSTTHAEAMSPAQAVLHEAIEYLSTRPLGRERVRWADLEQQLAGELASEGDASNAQDAHACIVKAVQALGDPHARFVPPPDPTPPATPSESSPVTSSHADATGTAGSSASAPPTIPSAPEGRMLADGCAYLVIPACAAADVEGLRAYARVGAAELARLGSQRPKGWLIELRLNGGGNLWPMLLALRPLLGDGPCMSMVESAGTPNEFGVSLADGAWIDWGDGPSTQLGWGPEAPPELESALTAPIAVLHGPWTMSSGEALAICVHGTGRSRTFGEATAGLTTVTNTFPLSDGSMLVLPVSRMGTRDGVVVAGQIVPDVTVRFDDWPTADDAPARAARAWLLDR